MQVHIHEWVLNGSWKCIAPGHVHDAPDILDAATVWHVLGVIKTHRFIHKKIEWTNVTTCYFKDGEQVDPVDCECGWQGIDYFDHLDDAVFYWLRDIEPRI